MLLTGAHLLALSLTLHCLLRLRVAMRSHTAEQVLHLAEQQASACGRSMHQAACMLLLLGFCKTLHRVRVPARPAATP
jgi:hypothetical protein